MSWFFPLLMALATTIYIHLIYLPNGGSLQDASINCLIILGLLYVFIDMILKIEKRHTIVHYTIVYLTFSTAMTLIGLGILGFILGDSETAIGASLFGIFLLWPWNKIYNFYDGLHIKNVTQKLLRQGRVNDLENWVNIIQKEQSED